MQNLTVTSPLLMPLDVHMAAVWGEAKLQLVDFIVADPIVGEYSKYRFLIESECSRRWLLLLSTPEGCDVLCVLNFLAHPYP